LHNGKSFFYLRFCLKGEEMNNHFLTISSFYLDSNF
jgi:hypothetical protein